MTDIGKHVSRILCVVVLILTLNGCEDPFDCIVDDRPVLNRDNLTQPVLNQVYTSSISVSIKNNANDDAYDYDWRLSGTLPPGISYTVNDRVLSFHGTATALGNYSYTINVFVSSPYYGPGISDSNASELCRQNVRREQVMVVAPL